METLDTKIKIKKASDLKFWHMYLNPDSHFFDHKTMKFFGDSMRNYGIRTHEKYIELTRKRPVNGGLWTSAYFDRKTLKQLTSIELERDYSNQ